MRRLAAALAVLITAVLAFVLVRRSRLPAPVAEVKIVDPENATVMDDRGAVTSIQAADLNDPKLITPREAGERPDAQNDRQHRESAASERLDAQPDPVRRVGGRIAQRADGVAALFSNPDQIGDAILGGHALTAPSAPPRRSS